jgi:hypothetical protein
VGRVCRACRGGDNHERLGSPLVVQRPRAHTRAGRAPHRRMHGVPRLREVSCDRLAAPLARASTADRSRDLRARSLAHTDGSTRARPVGTATDANRRAKSGAGERYTRRAEVFDRPGGFAVRTPGLHGHLCRAARALDRQAVGPPARAPAVRRHLRGSGRGVDRGTRRGAAAGDPAVVRALGDAAARCGQRAGAARGAWRSSRGVLRGASLGRLSCRLVRTRPGRAQRSRRDRHARRALAPVRELAPRDRHALPVGARPHVGRRAAQAADPARSAGTVLRRCRRSGDPRARGPVLPAGDAEPDALPGIARVGDRVDLPGADLRRAGAPRPGVHDGGAGQGARHRGQRAMSQRAVRAQPRRLRGRRAPVPMRDRAALDRRPPPAPPGPRASQPRRRADAPGQPRGRAARADRPRAAPRSGLAPGRGGPAPPREAGRVARRRRQERATR